MFVDCIARWGGGVDVTKKKYYEAVAAWLEGAAQIDTE
jgi:hypothetical protein